VARQEIFRGELDDPARAVVLFSLKLAEVLEQQGNLTDADGVLGEALDLTSPSSVDRARVLRSLARLARDRQREPEARGYLTEAIRIAQRANATDLLRDLEALR
jgi:serine/threonine-protein kinase